MTTARVFSWDWKAQPNLPAIAAAVTELSAKGQVFMREIDTGGDNYAWVISDAELTDRVEISRAERWMNDANSPLPERPDEATVEAWLEDVRREHYETAKRRRLYGVAR